MKSVKSLLVAVFLSWLAFTADGGRQFALATYKFAYVPNLSVSPTPMTIAAWVRVYQKSSAQTIVMVAGGSSHYNQIAFSSGLNKFYVASRAGGSENYAGGLTTPSSNVWYHVVGTFTSATLRNLYINGVSEGTNTTSTTPTLNNIGVGARTDGAFPVVTSAGLDGEIAWVGIWTNVLTEQEIGQLSGMGNPGKALRPTRVRPQALFAELPLYGQASPENNTVGPALILSNGVSYVPSPAIRQ